MKESKVLCTSKACSFETSSTSNCLVEHCQKVHAWRAIPCSFENCYFVAYNSGSSALHKASFHSKHRGYASKDFPCDWKKCKSSFRFNSQLEVHKRIHRNELLQCVFCPYRTNQESHLQQHYRLHFKMFDLKCSFCEKNFVSRSFLNRHYRREHSEETYTCQICSKYTGNRLNLQRHILEQHKLFSKWNEAEKTFQTFSRD